MALIGSSSSFVLTRSGKTSRCSECLKEIPAHGLALVAHRHGRVVKRVCSDVCREISEARRAGVGPAGAQGLPRRLVE